MYKKDDRVVFKVGEESFEYTVVKGSANNWYLSTLKDSNSIIFTKLNIVDKFKFIKDISKYATDDKMVSFPEIQYPDETEINKVIDALLKKCDEYNKQFNDTTTRYKDGDKIVFKTPDGQYNYCVVKGVANHWFLANADGYNHRLFVSLNITDKVQFCRDVSGCAVSDGMFPEIHCPDSTGISKVINKLMEMCEEKMKESLKTEKETSTETTSQKSTFKVGDYVRVISKADVKSSACYRFGFVSEMLPYCGEMYIVHKVSNCHAEAGSEPDDGMLYLLETIGGTILPFNFASSMLLPIKYPFVVSDCVQKTTDSETKAVSKKSTPKYKLKFTN